MITYNELKHELEADEIVNEIISGKLLGVYENGTYSHYPKKLVGYVFNGKEVPLKNERGFTLIEIIAVLLILGVLAAMIVSRVMVGVDGAASTMAISCVDELNTREKLLWSSVKLEPYTSEDIDIRIFRRLETSGIPWIDLPSEVGGEIRIDSRSFKLTRSGATEVEPAKWRKK